MRSRAIPLIILFVLLQCTGNSQESSQLKIIDLTQKQIAIMTAYEKHATEDRNNVLIDSIFTPYQNLWNGYLGDEKDFTTWINTKAYTELESYKQKSKNLNLEILSDKLNDLSSKMIIFTKHKPRGEWYFFFGPQWTNAGGLGNGTMLIDFAHEGNTSLESIESFFIHELNHQIYGNYIQPNDNAVLYRIINEGFASYVDFIYYNKKKTKNQALNYTPEEFKYAQENEIEIIKLLTKYKTSNETDIVNKFAARDLYFKDGYPGAIGYFIGFRVIEEYVRIHGKDSWIDIYELSPEKVLEKSRILINKEP